MRSSASGQNMRERGDGRGPSGNSGTVKSPEGVTYLFDHLVCGVLAKHIAGRHLTDQVPLAGLLDGSVSCCDIVFGAPD